MLFPVRMVDLVPDRTGDRAGGHGNSTILCPPEQARHGSPDLIPVLRAERQRNRYDRQNRIRAQLHQHGGQHNTQGRYLGPRG